ncbi:MAG: SOS response-associated peptidase [Gemmataceae bacterium]|nr:SOS response-associated peptidase [Gemmataceae bacterium]
MARRGGNVCGRFTLRSRPELVAEEFDRPVLPPFVPRWNIAPTQQVLALRSVGGQVEGVHLRWGLIPPWAKDLKTLPLLINAQSETAATKPSFRAAFRRRRCLVLADGYYEWTKVGQRKQPYYHRLRDDRPFAFAGLWERWEQDGPPIESCAILTTAANELAAQYHDRMPVILSRAARSVWLDPDLDDPAVLSELLRPYPAAEMVAYAVDPFVNKAGNEGPQCIAPRA